jgi:hypothetical protein
MTAPAPDLAWVPTELDWAAVVPGDLILGSDDQPLLVAAFTVQDRQMAVQLAGHPQPYPVDPQATVRVLVPIPERDALTTARDQLAAQVMERRSA